MVRRKSSGLDDPTAPRRSRRSSLRAPRPRPAFDQRLVESATDPERIAPLFGPDGENPLIRLRVLQYMSIIYMKKELAAEVAVIKRTGIVDDEQMRHVRRLMKDYIVAIRDLQYMLEPTSRFARTAKFLRDFFYIDRRRDSAVLESEGFLPQRWLTDEALDVMVPQYAGYGGFNHVRDTKQQKLSSFFGRLAVAILSGLSLIGPMLLMKIVGGVKVQLITASVCVLVVGAVLAWSEEMQKKDVVATTATYAAVLVVFVGANTS